MELHISLFLTKNQAVSNRAKKSPKSFHENAVNPGNILVIDQQSIRLIKLRLLVSWNLHWLA